MNDANAIPEGFDGSAHTPSVEPSVAQGNMTERAPHSDSSVKPEDSTEKVDDNRRDDLRASAPALPWWISEKYFWERATSGAFFLRPHAQYLDYVIEKAPKAADAGIGMVFPEGKHGETTESDVVTNAIEETRALLSSLKALNELEGQALEKFLLERCMRNAVYAATTQFELVQWTAREAANGNDASNHQNYGQKESRRDTFTATAGALFALCREAFPGADLSPVAFTKMARRVIYDTGPFEADKLRNPAQITEEQKASVSAATMTAEAF